MHGPEARAIEGPSHTAEIANDSLINSAYVRLSGSFMVSPQEV